jgi:hypothetical protein
MKQYDGYGQEAKRRVKQMDETKIKHTMKCLIKMCKEKMKIVLDLRVISAVCRES